MKLLKWFTLTFCRSRATPNDDDRLANVHQKSVEHVRNLMSRLSCSMSGQYFDFLHVAAVELDVVLQHAPQYAPLGQGHAQAALEAVLGIIRRFTSHHFRRSTRRPGFAQNGPTLV